MHDPNQDRLTLRRITYFRVKRQKLGPAYERFLTDPDADGVTPAGTARGCEARGLWNYPQGTDR
ncbi:hypothetical protein, partial [Actinoplanes regularis]|uniref:hypothetical protein n=1 Tax=Actinoplanes regularis TaxID=52697 RepID=UPI0019405F7B